MFNLDPYAPTFGDPTQICVEQNFVHCKCLFCLDDSPSDSNIVFPMSRLYDFVIWHSVNTNWLICVSASWYCPQKGNQSIASCKHSLETDQSMFVCITPTTFIWKWWNNWILAGISIYEQISCKSDTCIYLMCKEMQLTKMIIIHASQFWQNKQTSIWKGASLSDCNKVILRHCINGIWNWILLFWLL